MGWFAQGQRQNPFSQLWSLDRDRGEERPPQHHRNKRPRGQGDRAPSSYMSRCTANRSQAVRNTLASGGQRAQFYCGSAGDWSSEGGHRWTKVPTDPALQSQARRITDIGNQGVRTLIDDEGESVTSQAADISKQLATYRFPVKHPRSSRRYLVTGCQAKMEPLNTLQCFFWKCVFQSIKMEHTAGCDGAHL